jgi:hypothetical protein
MVTTLVGQLVASRPFRAAATPMEGARWLIALA